MVADPQTPLSLNSPISSSLPKRQPAGSHQDRVCPWLEDYTTLAPTCPPCKGTYEAEHPRGPTLMPPAPQKGIFQGCYTSYPRDPSSSPTGTSLRGVGAPPAWSQQALRDLAEPLLFSGPRLPHLQPGDGTTTLPPCTSRIRETGGVAVSGCAFRNSSAMRTAQPQRAKQSAWPGMEGLAETDTHTALHRTHVPVISVHAPVFAPLPGCCNP